MALETWIIYKAADPIAPDWLQRHLLPSGSLTQILAEEVVPHFGGGFSWSGRLPQVGDRMRCYGNPNDPGNGVTHGKDSNWVVAEVQEFSSPATPTKIVVCLCEFDLIAAEWEELIRVQP
jgi:hypothetical protein